jgi:hypothetical protein
MVVWDEDLEGDKKQEEKIEGVELQPEDGHPVMLVQDAGEMDGEEDDELAKNVSEYHSELGIVWNTLTDVFVCLTCIYFASDLDVLVHHNKYNKLICIWLLILGG